MNDRERSHNVSVCIFDLDGVLVDTAIYHYRAWKRLANSLGFDFSEAANESLKGVNRMTSLKMILGWANVTKNEKELKFLAEQKNRWYKEMISTMNADFLLSGVEEFLKELKERGYRLAVGSASKNAEQILLKTGIRHYFDVVVDGNLVNESKPNPRVFLKGAELMSVAPEECVVFEDAQAGVDAALNAHMKVIGVDKSTNLTGTHGLVPGLNAMNVDRLQYFINRKQ